MQEAGADYTSTLRGLASTDPSGVPIFRHGAFLHWHESWQARLARQRQGVEEARALMRTHNPAVIPRNHRVEEALAAAEKGDMTVMERLLAALKNPYADHGEHDAYRMPPPSAAAPYRTFCGT